LYAPLLADTVTFLLSKGADATAADMGAKTPLMLAASEGHAAIVQALLAHLSALGKGFLFFAVFDVRFAVGCLLLVSSTNIAHALADMKKMVERKDQDKRTALWWAACNGHADVVRLLLPHGANPRVKDADKRTPGTRPLCVCVCVTVITRRCCCCC
jgi:ankyrin repeat protein